MNKISETADIRKKVIMSGIIEVGENARIGPNCIISDKVKIGRWVNLVRDVRLFGVINIGDFSILAGETCMISRNHNYKKACINSRFYRKCLGERAGLISKGPINLGEDVWTGWRSMILGGVMIGRGAIVGAGAVVTNNVEPYSIVGGVPARHIKYRFSQETINYLEKLKWWTWSDEKLKQHADDVFSRIYE